MKAVAVIPKKEKSVHLVEMEKPSVKDVKGGRGVLVEVLRVGACGTDREINNAEYGVAPPGSDFLVLGHENFGRVVEVGEKVGELKPGDFVVATVRRPGKSIYDQIGTQDFTTDDRYFERGISRLHGFMAEFYAESADYLIKIPASLAEVAVLLEPVSIIEKGLKQASDIQERLKIWKPKTAAVLGTGNVGLLTVMALRMRGYEVHGFGWELPEGYFNGELCEAIGATYDSTQKLNVVDSIAKYGQYDLVFECTGYSPIIFDAMQALNENGILILSSVTGGGRKTDGVPSDKINQQFVLGNRAMVGTVNANREHFEMGVKDFALCEAMYPGWLARMLTHKVEGLENFAEAFDILENGAKHKAIKTFFEVKSF
ncbi:MAG: glucose 1-dehydrogenase [Acidobacteria bacterium]|nr:glucose 1-dehydrogenase [Acidobacteriota bacterium]MBK8148755.1 glucose 1-dehydrogenase [Acidobacteriota bacterium]MBK8810198.1 glucose 1-dehydrogenase [Acidobacteriota bacterium]